MKIVNRHNELPKSRFPTPRFLLLFLFSLTFSLFSFLLFAEDDVRLNTVKYGTETEIASLIQSLRAENEDSLDNEIIALIENTRNQRILVGAFGFFGDREKNGLEGRALRAVEERDEETNETVLAAIDYLGKIKSSNAAPLLRELLERNETRFMNSAFRALGRVSGPDSRNSGDTAEYLIDFYENRDPGEGNQHEVITALGATKSSSAVEFLAGIAVNNEERTPLRIAAVESLAAIADPDGLDAILACISANDPNIRSTAVGALGPFSGTAVDSAILDAFRDSFFRTRLAAAQASRQRKLAAAIPFLKFRAERDDVPSVRENSIRALGAIANAEAIKILEELFTERKNSERIRTVAAEMIMEVSPAQYLDKLVIELDDAKQRNQTSQYNGFLKVLGGTKSANVETVTRRLMQDKGIVEKSYALDMAANNNLTVLADEIKSLAEDRNESLARKARRTLDKLGIR